jgi:hypothetical protein
MPRVRLPLAAAEAVAGTQVICSADCRASAAAAFPVDSRASAAAAFRADSRASVPAVIRVAAWARRRVVRVAGSAPEASPDLRGVRVVGVDQLVAAANLAPKPERTLPLGAAPVRVVVPVRSLATLPARVVQALVVRGPAARAAVAKRQARARAAVANKPVRAAQLARAATPRGLAARKLYGLQLTIVCDRSI